MKDPIVKEVRKHRESIAHECGYDMHKIFLYAKEQQKGHKTVNLQAGHERATLPKPQRVAEGSAQYGYYQDK